MLFDAHTHFQEMGTIEKVKTFLADPALENLGQALNATVAPGEWALIREMAAYSGKIVPCYGIHPWKVLDAPTDWASQIAKLLTENPAAGVGETGIDKVKKEIDIEIQKRIFAEQLALAHDFARPFVVHCVRAWDWTVRIIEASKPAAPFILHFFNGPREIMEKLMRLGGYISFNARQMQRSDDRIRDLLKIVPLERLLLETDFPYLGQDVEPITPLRYIARLESFYFETARIKGIEIDSFKEAIRGNGKVFTNRTLARPQKA